MKWADEIKTKLAEMDRSIAQMARAIGWDEGTVYNVLNGYQEPSARLTKAIDEFCREEKK